MRLTLRTLLAYLDDTLEPQDAQLLREKLSQSGFATQLVQRIRDSLTNPNLSAPAPDSVHPVEDPNMMSNYLDSTLSAEQVAEVEKACLESAPHMAEAAACHQILTMVLGKPAEPSSKLRKRIMSMVDEDGQIMATRSGAIAGKLGIGSSPIAGEIGPRFSGVDLNDGFETEDAGVAERPTVERDDSLPDFGSDSNVKPLAAGDSGVFEAATKLREQSHQFAEAGSALDDDVTLAGSRPLRELEKSDFYEGEVRTSRITPWLVSLALVGVLLFAIVKIFAPLLGPQQLASSGMESVEPDSPAASKEPMTLDGSDEAEPASAGDMTAPAADSQAKPSDNRSNMAAVPKETDDTSEDLEFEAGAPPLPIEMAGGDAAAKDDETIVPAESIAGRSPDTEPAPMNSDPGAAAEPDAVVASVPKGTEMEPTESETQPHAGAPANPIPAGLVLSEDALVAVRGEGEEWKLIGKDETIVTGTHFACAPEYRCEVQLVSQVESKLTLVGSTQISMQSIEPVNTIDAKFGRFIWTSKMAGESLRLTAAGQSIRITNESDESELAIDVKHQRELGSDPLVPENHQSVLVLTSLKGIWTIEPPNVSLRVERNQQLMLDSESTDQEQPITLDELPTWVDPEIDNSSLEAEAAAALLELVRADTNNSLPLALRVALEFRRNEVAALAGQSLLALGDASAYFGVDGLFSKPKQRLYWDAHLDAIRDMMNRGVEDAAAVRMAIAGDGETAMDNADGDTLYRLLTGYSQDQLKTGGDAELVDDLQSVSMPVRVLASEHLRDISGTTLFFRPEEQVISRRDEVVKKWKVRLRKESIRYPEVEIDAAADEDAAADNDSADPGALGDGGTE
ncbi:MAG: hypothetical protein AAFV88_01660 [Planctomycetota bacterium]